MDSLFIVILSHTVEDSLVCFLFHCLGNFWMDPSCYCSPVMPPSEWTIESLGHTFLHIELILNERDWNPVYMASCWKLYLHLLITTNLPVHVQLQRNEVQFSSAVVPLHIFVVLNCDNDQLRTNEVHEIQNTKRDNNKLMYYVWAKRLICILLGLSSFYFYKALRLMFVDVLFCKYRLLYMFII